ncbi:hypothetical protein BMF94_5400 [Rhodotorula taiwanensis]|uniref:Uncharacterized protein n=1 Tax=Rhodotorula taiwanensis TaxID=741276 RepID=A0A2S5B4A5_9BASI|nr:hypothetical protein BMF94_5400 [Rhodotorula taiwanensis]
MPLAPILITRDLVHFRKSPPRRVALSQLATAFLSLLASPSDPSAASLRAAFVPALTGNDSRPSDPQVLDLELQRLFALAIDEVEIVLLQTVPGTDQVDEVWRAMGGAEKMQKRLFMALTLEGELESAREEGEKEEEANLSIMILGTLAHELAHYVFVKVHGYHQADDMSDTSSLYTTHTRHSVSSRTSATGSTIHPGVVLAPHRNRDDAGTYAVTSLFGCDFELVTYSLGTREVIKRRVPTRRSPSMVPPIVYRLIGDTPAIKDCTSMPLTTLGCTPPHRQGGEMYDVTSVLTPRGLARMHGRCLVHSTMSSASSTVSRDDLGAAGI